MPTPTGRLSGSSRTTARVDIFFLQEVKVAYDPDKKGKECPVEHFRDRLLRLGFKSAVAGARVTEKNGRSGGVAIAWRGHLNITCPQVVRPHRAVSVELHTHGAGAIHLVCVCVRRCGRHLESPGRKVEGGVQSRGQKR